MSFPWFVTSAAMMIYSGCKADSGFSELDTRLSETGAGFNATRINGRMHMGKGAISQMLENAERVSKDQDAP